MVTCWKNPKGEFVYIGTAGRKGYSPVSCDAAKNAYYKVHGSAEFKDIKGDVKVAHDKYVASRKKDDSGDICSKLTFGGKIPCIAIPAAVGVLILLLILTKVF